MPKYLDSIGTFECIVQEPESGWFGESGEKQTPYIRIPVMVTEGAERGALAVWRGWLSPAAFDNTIARLAEVFGFDGDLPSLHLGKQTLAGKPCSITTELETYEGKDRIRVAWINPPGGGGPKPMDEAKVNALLAKLTPKAKAVAKATLATIPTIPTEPAKPKPAPKPEQPEDDVLF